MLLLGSGSDAFFNNLFGGNSFRSNLFGGNLFGGGFGQSRRECKRTCDDIMDDSKDADECVDEARLMSRRMCIFDRRSCQRACMKMDEEDYCPPGCLESIGQDPSEFDTYESCQYSLKKNYMCRNHRDSCSKRCPAQIVEDENSGEVTLECPDECLPIADQDYEQCWSGMKASRTCSKYKGCFERCMSNDTCPEECNISKILGYNACITFINNFPVCQRHRDCYGKCPKDFLEEEVKETEEGSKEDEEESEEEEEEEPEESKRKGILNELSELLSNVNQNTFKIGFNKLTDQVSEIANIYVDTIGDLFEMDQDEEDETDDEDSSETGFEFTNIFDRFNSFKPDFNGLSDRLTAGAEIYVSSLSDLVKEIETDWEPISKELEDAGEALVSLVFNQTKIEGVGKSLTDALSDLVEKFDPSLLDKLADGSELVIDGFEVVGKRLTDLTSDFDLEDAGDALGDIFGDMAESFEEHLDKMDENLGVVNEIAGGLGEHLDNLGEQLGIDDMIDTIGDIGDKLIDTDAMSDLGDTLTDLFGSTLQNLIWF